MHLEEDVSSQTEEEKLKPSFSRDEGKVSFQDFQILPGRAGVGVWLIASLSDRFD